MFCHPRHAGRASGASSNVARSGDDSAVQRGYACRVTDFVNKPLNHLILQQRVRRVLEAAETRAELPKSEHRLKDAQRIAKLGETGRRLSVAVNLSARQIA